MTDAARHLTDYLEASAARYPDRVAVVDPTGGSVTFSELNRDADGLAGFFRSRGVTRGDRVGVVLPKSSRAVAALFGIMKAGAAYVPVDCTAPAERSRQILADCAVRALVIDARFRDAIPDIDDLAAVVVVGSAADDKPLRETTPYETAITGMRDSNTPPRDPADLAYILYTSGSTGKPKGVMLTHENALSFVEWCSVAFEPTADDRFSSHAPFHFDLSIFDIYLAVKHAASIYLIAEDLGKAPKDLARFIAANRLTIWYSTPSTLTLLEQFGRLHEHDASSLRLVFFAGEVFPIKHLRALKRQWPHAMHYNLYGPTETNVCTFARIPDEIPDERDTPYPIGFACAHCKTLVLDPSGDEVASGEDGLLYISGPSVFPGYWNRPIENAAAFVNPGNVRWYNTGDVVRWSAGEGFIYVGRKDRMIKRRGYRIELGEIERALYSHPGLLEVAVVAVPDSDAGVKIVAYLVPGDPPSPSIVELKTFCGTKLPAYMSPDRFVLRNRLPKTSTDKVDYQTLTREFSGVEVA